MLTRAPHGFTADADATADVDPLQLVLPSVVGGLVTLLTAYGIARAMEIEPGKARGMALAMGIFTIAGPIVNAWVKQNLTAKTST